MMQACHDSMLAMHVRIDWDFGPTSTKDALSRFDTVIDRVTMLTRNEGAAPACLADSV